MGGETHRIIFIDLFQSLLRDFETKINADADYINAELEKTGKIN